MTRPTPRLQECCSWCRHPVTHCTEPACDSTTTYSGMLIRGKWTDVGAEGGGRRSLAQHGEDLEMLAA